MNTCHLLVHDRKMSKFTPEMLFTEYHESTMFLVSAILTYAQKQNVAWFFKNAHDQLCLVNKSLFKNIAIRFTKTHRLMTCV